MAEKHPSIHAFFSMKKRKEAQTSDELNTQSLTQTHFNSAFMTHIYKEKLDSIDLNSIFSTFVTRNEQKEMFFFNAF
jgi:hypothetical protein